MGQLPGCPSLGAGAVTNLQIMPVICKNMKFLIISVFKALYPWTLGARMRVMSFVTTQHFNYYREIPHCEQVVQ